MESKALELVARNGLLASFSVFSIYRRTIVDLAVWEELL